MCAVGSTGAPPSRWLARLASRAFCSPESCRLELSGGKSKVESCPRAILELLRLTDLSVLLPRFEAAALQTVAAHEHRTVDALLAAEPLDSASARSTWLVGEIAGLADALAWPAAARQTSTT